MLGVAWATLGELGKLAQLGLRAVLGPAATPCSTELRNMEWVRDTGQLRDRAQPGSTAWLREHSLAEGH